MNGEAKYRLIITKAATKDKEKIKSQPSLKATVEKLLDILRANPFLNPPPYEKLIGNLNGFYSRRINSKHRLVYSVEDHTVKIVSMWSHYER